MNVRLAGVGVNGPVTVTSTNFVFACVSDTAIDALPADTGVTVNGGGVGPLPEPGETLAIPG